VREKERFGDQKGIKNFNGFDRTWLIGGGGGGGGRKGYLIFGQ
jgi:hypothetical protein